MKKEFTAACIQINSSDNIDSNTKKLIESIKKASKLGADFITTPENSLLMANNRTQLLDNLKTINEHSHLHQIQNLAAKLNKYILIGSIAIKETKNSKKALNRSFLIDNNGNICAYYDKIHLYNASVTNGELHQESRNFKAGKKIITHKLPFAHLGMSICYDLRFPILYKKLSLKGANIITIPSAFTNYTGKAHWHILLRARAIENACFIIAPAQTGTHNNKRKTYGHSMIINPWGQILAEAKQDETIISAKINLEEVQNIKQQLYPNYLKKPYF